MILDLKNIDKSYGEGDLKLPVLKDVTFQVEEGEYIAIMGPSGSGKTTLMNIVGCLDHFDEGQYILDGVNISDLDDDHLADVRLHKIGFVFQTFNLLANETALENVALPLVYAGISKEKRNEMAMNALHDVGLEDRATHRPSELSGGQKQRVAIARAMINQPRILLADEPTGALDQASGKQVMNLFEDLNQKGVTIVMITHDANVAANAHKILHIVDGEILENKGGQHA